MAEAPWSPSVPPELFYSAPSCNQSPVPCEDPPTEPGLSRPELTKSSSKQSNPAMPEGNGEEGAHHKQLNITLVKVSEGTDTPHEDKPPPTPHQVQ